MKKPPQSIPLRNIFIEHNDAPVQTHDYSKGGIVIDLCPTTNDRLDFELSLPTMDPALKRAIEPERKKCASELATLQLKQTVTNTDNAKAKRKKVTREELAIYRDQHVIEHDGKRGWIKAACLQFHITENTIRARMKENE